MSASPLKVVLVDDQDLIRTGFAMILGTQPDFEVVGEAGDGEEALAVIEALRGEDRVPDVVLMDVRMPGVDGIEATAQVVAEHPDSRVLILTTFDLDEYAFAGLRAGASGFLLKDTRPADLAAAIRTVAAGDAVVSPRVTKRILELFATQMPADAGAGRPARDERLERLTTRESEVFSLLARGLSNAEIAEELVVSETTVKTHVGSILAKLGVRDRVQAVVLAYETGVVTPG